MKKVLLGFAVLAANLLAARGHGAPIVVNGGLQNDGAPYRTFGINYYDSFARYLQNGDTSYRAGFDTLRRSGVSYIRFQVLPYWPIDAKTYVNNPAALLAKLDQFVADAEAANIGLIPSVFWCWGTVPDVMGENLSAWGSSSSRTRIFAQSFAQQLAARYAGRASIWAWEMTNEANDWVDLPDGYYWMSQNLNTAAGTPAQRTTADNYTHAQLLSAYTAFAAAIRRGDPAKLVTSGYDLPNNAAYHRLNNLPVSVDTCSQFYAAVGAQQSPGDLISTHIYQESFLTPNRFADVTVNAYQFLPYTVSASTQAGKPLMLGEFGTQDNGQGAYSTPALSFQEFRRFAGAILSNYTATNTSTGLASAWVFDLYWGGAADMYCMSATVRPERLRLLGKLNDLMPLSKVGDEWLTLNLAVPADVSYGADGSYIFAPAASGTVAFTNATFGDPAPSTTKIASDNSFAYAGAEGDSKYFDTPAEVAYGANGKYQFLWGVSGTVPLLNTTFGDPVPSVSKYGYSMPYRQCAAEGQANTFVFPTDVAYGSGGKFFFRHGVVGSLSFDNPTFGDPLPTIVKKGYARRSHNSASAVVKNPSFEVPIIPSNYYEAPTSADWTFTGKSGVQLNGSAWAAAPAPDDIQTAYLQVTAGQTNGSISQNVSFAADGSFLLTFFAATRANYQAVPVQVSVDGIAVGQFQPSNTFTPFRTPAFSVSAGTHTIKFGVLGSGVEGAVFLDAIALIDADVSVKNAGFEQSNVAAGQWVQRPTNASWSFENLSGVFTNGSGWSATPIPSGNSAAYLQDVNAQPAGAMSQDVIFGASGKYTLSCQAATRQFYQALSLQVYLNGSLIATFSPNDQYQQFTTAPFTVSAPGKMNIKLKVSETPSSDGAVFVDNIQIAQVSP